MAGKKRYFAILGCFLIFLPFAIYGGDSKEDYKYVASRFSLHYHLPTCKRVRRIQDQNRVFFSSAEEAVKAGYIPCGLCKPPDKDSSTEKDVLKNP